MSPNTTPPNAIPPLPLTLPLPITILMPTYNRPRDLRVCLQYILEGNASLKILILDGSSPENKVINHSIVSGLNHENVKKLDYPQELHLAVRLQQGLKEVSTPYVLIWPDDDFLISADLAKHIDFLEKNPEYMASLGRVLCLLQSVRIARWWPKRSYTLLDHLKHSPTIVEDNPVKRALIYQTITHMAGMPLFYSVRRTPQLKEAFELMNESITYTSMEFIANYVSINRGKIKSFKELYAFRNYSNDATCDSIREGATHYFGSESLNYMKKVYVDDLIKRFSYSEQEAKFAFSLLIDETYDQNKITNGYGMSLEDGVPFFRLKFRFQSLMNLFWPRLLGFFYQFDYHEFRRLIRLFDNKVKS